MTMEIEWLMSGSDGLICKMKILVIIPTMHWSKSFDVGARVFAVLDREESQQRWCCYGEAFKERFFIGCEANKIADISCSSLQGSSLIICTVNMCVCMYCMHACIVYCHGWRVVFWLLKGSTFTNDILHWLSHSNIHSGIFWFYLTFGIHWFTTFWMLV